MKAAALMLCLAIALILAAINAAAVFDGLTAIYANNGARTVIAGLWMVVGLALGAMALALIARRGHRVADEDFEAEIKRQIDTQH
jgi:uncharacterized membrane protein YhaH (DUF805 family)